MGSQSSLEKLPESVPRFQLRINTNQTKIDAWEECMADQECRLYVDLDDSQYLNGLFDHVIQEYYADDARRLLLTSEEQAEMDQRIDAITKAF